MKRAAAMVALAALACAAPADPGPDEAAVAQLDVGLTDFAIATSARTVVAGEVEVRITNAGATAHDLRIEGGDVDLAVPPLQPGATTTATIDPADTDQAGTLVLWCSLPGHRRQGMETTISVAA